MLTGLGEWWEVESLRQHYQEREIMKYFIYSKPLCRERTDPAPRSLKDRRSTASNMKLTSTANVGVEQSFSVYQNVLTDGKQRLTEHTKKI